MKRIALLLAWFGAGTMLDVALSFAQERSTAVSKQSRQSILQEMLTELNRLQTLTSATEPQGWWKSCYHCSVYSVSAWGRSLPVEFTVHPEHQQRPARILLVEDDPLQQELFGSTFTSQGYEVEAVSDGLNAVWKVRDGQYDLVLCDYKLPEIDGFAMARLIRELMGANACPALIALTGAPASLMSKEAVPGSAFDEIIPKPTDLDALISAVRRHLDARLSIRTKGEAPRGLTSRHVAGCDAGVGSADSREGRSAPPRILVVEDDAVQQSVLRSALQELGFAVEVAGDGLQAFRMIRADAFDLALIDYQLPEMDGLATGRLIFGLLDEEVRPRMIAFTSAPSHLAGRLAGAGVAFDEVVPKSAGLPALLATMERHLRSSPRVATRRAAEIVFPLAA